MSTAKHPDAATFFDKTKPTAISDTDFTDLHGFCGRMLGIN
jgi:hypothetical protein